MSSADLRSTCEVLKREYTKEYERCIENMLTNQKVEEFDYEGLKMALEQEFERRANKKVIESNVLKGLNLEDIRRAGEHLILHDGCMSFFQSITNNQHLNVNAHVLSYCWCADLIPSSFSSGGIPTMNVHANEFLYENSLYTSKIIKKIETPIDKLQAFTNILKNSDESDKTNLTIYIGDSVGDLLCLLEADIGSYCFKFKPSKNRNPLWCFVCSVIFCFNKETKSARRRKCVWLEGVIGHFVYGF
ncbi:putative HAD superfamily protein [Helianthus annuus]|uniref:HAD superfamily protein n=1 Tax=Helianthus annuus TaxID=4232 RepID=A0A251S6D3_HELAN|nr:putative HAD superfamily protein [Helianthus annuus]KAJ0472174.1 putative HAD superfamily protein [Helianthus annuus]